jgi:hypothetical protein
MQHGYTAKYCHTCSQVTIHAIVQNESLKLYVCTKHHAKDYPQFRTARTVELTQTGAV